MSVLPSITWNVNPFVLPGSGFSLRWFTVLWLSELGLGYWALSRQVRRGGGDEEEAADLAVYVWLGLLGGARLGEGLFFNLELTLGNPQWLFDFAHRGGLSGHGAALGIWVAVLLFARRRGMPALEVCDRLCYSAAISATIHRIVNLVNSELVGIPTAGGWGIRFPRYDGVPDGPLRQPVQLYEVGIGLCVLGVLYLCDRRWQRGPRPRGALTAVLLVSYFSARLLIEFVKEPLSVAPTAWFDMDQLLSLAFIVAGLGLLWRTLKVRSKSAWLVPAPG